jgi:hypothetical protein
MHIINVITIIITIYIIYVIVEICKKEYIQSYTNINDDKNKFITIFQNNLERAPATPAQIDDYQNIIYKIIENIILIIITIIAILYIINHDMTIKEKKKYAKIFPI